jgi:hypothetical protein
MGGQSQEIANARVSSRGLNRSRGVPDTACSARRAAVTRTWRAAIRLGDPPILEDGAKNRGFRPEMMAAGREKVWCGGGSAVV